MNTVKIGNQIWSAENIEVDHYRNGDKIPHVQNKNDWANLTTGAWCYSSNRKKYGKLYNWYAVNDKRGMEPEGYHIPTRTEFQKLITTVDEDSRSLKIEESRLYDIGCGTNESGFSALYKCSRKYDGSYYGQGYASEFWSSTGYGFKNAFSFHLMFNSNEIYIFDLDKKNGFSVRVVKD